MEIIARKNAHFMIAATYVSEGKRAVRPQFTLIPMGLLDGVESFDDFISNNDLLSEIRYLDVDECSVSELEERLIQEEQEMLKVFSEGVA